MCTCTKFLIYIKYYHFSATSLPNFLAFLSDIGVMHILKVSVYMNSRSMHVLHKQAIPVSKLSPPPFIILNVNERRAAT